MLELATEKFELGLKKQTGIDTAQNINEAITLFKSAAYEGLEEAAFHLANLYYGGTDVPYDKTKAIKFFELAAKCGNVEANYYLGLLFKDTDSQKAIQYFTDAALNHYVPALTELGLFFCKSEETKQTGLKSLEHAADNNDSLAQFHLASLYWNGKKVEKDKEYAWDLFSRSAKLGNPNAYEIIGRIYYRGHGNLIKEDKKEGIKWLTLAAKEGSVRAQLRLAKHYLELRDYKKAFYFTQLAADKGDVEAQLNLSKFFFDGLGVSKQYQQAFEWILKVAEQEIPMGEFRVGIFYFYGRGVKKDEKKAILWLNKAAAHGISDAHFFLGKIYYNQGNFFKAKEHLLKSLEFKMEVFETRYLLGMIALKTKNYSVAVQYFKELADRYLQIPSAEYPPYITEMYSQTAYQLAHLYKNGQGVQCNNAFYATYLELAAKYDHLDAQCEIGQYYKNKDDKAAFNWISLAASGSHPKALCDLGLMYRDGIGTKVDYHSAFQCFLAAGQYQDSKGKYLESIALHHLAVMYPYYGSGNKEENHAKGEECLRLAKAADRKPQHQIKVKAIDVKAESETLIPRTQSKALEELITNGSALGKDPTKLIKRDSYVELALFEKGKNSLVIYKIPLNLIRICQLSYNISQLNASDIPYQDPEIVSYEPARQLSEISERRPLRLSIQLAPDIEPQRVASTLSTLGIFPPNNASRRYSMATQVTQNSRDSIVVRITSDQQLDELEKIMPGTKKQIESESISGENPLFLPKVLDVTENSNLIFARHQRRKSQASNQSLVLRITTEQQLDDIFCRLPKDAIEDTIAGENPFVNNSDRRPSHHSDEEGEDITPTPRIAS